MHNLLWLNFQDNHLGTGEAGDLNFLSSLPNATNLNILALGSNNFGGVFPESIGNLSTNLGSLILENNKIGGSIPTEMANSVNFQALDMTNNHFIGNKFNGKIPLSSKNLTPLAYLYLGGNNLHGNIPPSLGKCPLVDLALDGNNLSGTIPKQVLTLSTSLNLYLLDNHLVGSIQLEIGNLINLEQLDVSRNMLSGKIPSTLASKSFVAKCDTLGRIRHRNLVKVFTACSSVDYNGTDFKALVYEFMVNGSLEDWLHANENEDEPSNVLLNDEMIGHVGDFGLARFLPEGTYNSFATQSSSIGLRGSVGYAAPEYGMGNEVTTFGDVYSYGILLLEMFTGKRPTDNMFNDSLSLHNFAKMALPEQVVSVVDPTLIQQREIGEGSSSVKNTQNQSSTGSHKIYECFISILNIGIACS
ncbi:putative receptor-like protein kinase At3g47110 [Camellia sinensis]|uniref:putative receptor-like protein kinase At3g47110 n=1 Tax=Camellia sinensis TaxID=4442 RepID=UPI0010358D03|nr:putative receptor-like protein kinase At3g47110 [Camellia sinensis]